MRRVWVFCLVIGCLIAAGCGGSPAPKPAGRAAAGVTVEGVAVGGLYRDEMTAALRELASRRYAAPVDARFADADGAILPEEAGRLLDVPATVGVAMAAPAGSAVEAVYRPLAPGLTAAVLAAASQAGTCTTPILDASPGRVANIRLTAVLVNNAVIAPGQEFSFNARTGEPTPARGFVPATVFVDGRHEQEVGGGMCQVSSTLYGAVLAAGLKVTERHAHSQPVSYAPPGRDATTYTDKDLRFVNSGRGTIVVRAVAAGKNVAVDLFALPRGE